MPAMFQKLITNIKGKRPFIYIQTHNFPDPDAVATGFALQQFFLHFSIESRIIYNGELQRKALTAMIDLLKIDIRRADAYAINVDDLIIIVDGCKGNNNVTSLRGQEIAVIDHHETPKADDVPYLDIRPSWGSCSSILVTYYEEAGLEMTKNVATALLIGLNRDTDMMTRKVSDPDIHAFAILQQKADRELVSKILKNNIQRDDLYFFRKMLDSLIIQSQLAYCYFTEGCPQNLMGILGDFLLSVEEIKIVVIIAHNEDAINLSLRTKDHLINVNNLIKDLLDGMGAGGGHGEMAGGIIEDTSLFDEQAFYQKLIAYLQSHPKEDSTTIGTEQTKL